MSRMSQEGKTAAIIAAAVIGVTAGASYNDLTRPISKDVADQQVEQADQRIDRVVKAAAGSVLKTVTTTSYADLMCRPMYCQERLSEGFSSYRTLVTKSSNGESSILSGSVTVNVKGAKDPNKIYALDVSYQECPLTVKPRDCLEDFKPEGDKHILIRAQDRVSIGTKAPSWEVMFDNGQNPDSSMGDIIDNADTQQINNVLKVVQQFTDAKTLTP